MIISAYALLEREDFSEDWNWMVKFISFNQTRAEAWAATHAWRKYVEVALLPEDAEELNQLEQTEHSMNLTVQIKGDKIIGSLR